MQHEDYIATYSLKDKLTFLAMALVTGLLSALFLAHSGYWFVKCVLAAICCFSAFWAYVFLVSSVRFSDERIQVKVPPFVDYSRSYAEIETLKTQPGNLKVQFAGGKSMNLLAGLGDSKKIASILEKRTDVIPEVVRWRR